MIEFSVGLSLLMGLLLLIVHVSFALGVYEDALRMHFGPKGTLFVGPGMWMFATVMLGPFLAALYWLMHHSTLRRQP
jgi:uncharacterized membrane protein